jgi:trans-aconitate 2-methyltransferase
MTAHHWDPQQYEKFEIERTQPFLDLLLLIQPLEHPRIVDLGCGNGTLTKLAHDHFHASYTLGIDQSKEMLAKAHSLQNDHLVFKEQDIRTFHFKEPFNLVISNAALQWIPDHRVLLNQITKLIAPGGQLAIQIAANENYATHEIAAELADEAPFAEALTQNGSHMPHLLNMEEYAQLLDQLGYESQVVRLQLYAHFLESTASVIEWVKGSLLTYYKSHLGPQLYEIFFKEYQKRLIDRLGWSEPFFYPVKRLFLWGQLPTR